jgi:hypothetical protein
LNREAVNSIYFSVCSFSPTHKSCAGTRTTCTWSTESSTMYPGSFRKPWRRIQRFNNIFIDTSFGLIVLGPNPACLKNNNFRFFLFPVEIAMMGFRVKFESFYKYYESLTFYLLPCSGSSSEPVTGPCLTFLSNDSIVIKYLTFCLRFRPYS